MVEYLLLPAIGLLLLGCLSVQFLVQGVVYGPRSRRVISLLGIPAVVVGGVVDALTHVRPLWGRVALGGMAALACYVGLASAAVFRWRRLKLAALAGDLSALRQRLETRRREVEALFWEMAAHPERPSATPAEVESAVRVPDGAALLRAWQSADPAEEASRAALIHQWRVEFARCSRAELLRRARVLEAVSRDVPEDQSDTLGARLAALWSAVTALPEQRSVGVESPRARWDDARQDVARLQAEMAEMMRQHGVLRRRRLPLD